MFHKKRTSTCQSRTQAQSQTRRPPGWYHKFRYREQLRVTIAKTEQSGEYTRTQAVTDVDFSAPCGGSLRH